MNKNHRERGAFSDWRIGIKVSDGGSSSEKISMVSVAPANGMCSDFIVDVDMLENVCDSLCYGLLKQIKKLLVLNKALFQVFSFTFISSIFVDS